MSLHNS